jgi:hypothetical protein
MDLTKLELMFCLTKATFKNEKLVLDLISRKTY